MKTARNLFATGFKDRVSKKEKGNSDGGFWTAGRMDNVSENELCIQRR